MSARRDWLTAGAVAVVGVLLAALVVSEPSEVEHAQQWLRGVPPRGTAGAAFARPTVTPAGRASDAMTSETGERLRRLRRRGRGEDLATRLARLRADGGGAVELEAQSLLLAHDPERFDVDACESAAGAFFAPDLVAQLLRYTPDGLGDPDHPDRAHAKAFVSTLLVAATVPSSFADPLAELIGGDGGRLVDALDAAAAVATLLPDDAPNLRNGRLPRDLCVEVCQALLDGGHWSLALGDTLAAIAADPDRTQRERALAAMALSELADLPIGLTFDLPRDEADAAAAPRFTLARAWREVRDLDAEAGFVARVAMAVRGWDALDVPGALSFDPPAALRRHFRGCRQWLDRHVDPRTTGRQISDDVRAIAAGRLPPVEHLRDLAGGAATSAEVLAHMEHEPELVLALHRLLTLTADTGPERMPRRAASAGPRGLVTAWRKALGSASSSFTLRVARVEQRLDGLRLLGEETRAVRPGATASFEWTETFEDRFDPDPTWVPPGGLPPPDPLGTLNVDLRLVLRWSDAGARLQLHTLDAHVDHARGGGSGGSAGAVWPAEIPVALAPWTGAHDVASRRALLVHCAPAVGVPEVWTLDDWRDAAARAFARLEGRVEGEPGTQSHALWMLGDTLALLRPEIDTARLHELDAADHGLGPGVAHTLGLAGRSTRLVAHDLDNARRLVELSRDAPDPELREEATWRLTGLHEVDRMPPPVAEEVLAVDAAAPGSLDADVVAAARRSVEGAAELRTSAINPWIVFVLATVLGVLFLATWLRQSAAHGARGTAAAMLAWSLLIAQVHVIVDGMDLDPDWAGWALAAWAARCVARGRADSEMRIAIGALGGTAIASLVAALGGEGADLAGAIGAAASGVAAIGALVSCVAIARIAPALIADLDTPLVSPLPRRPARSKGWTLGLRCAAGAAVAATLLLTAATQPPHVGTTVGLFYLPIAFCFGGIVVWRLRLMQTVRAAALPLPFLIGLVVPGLVLLVTEILARLGIDPSLEAPLGLALRVWIFCALLFALTRVFDAARLRGRADLEADRSA